MRIHASHYETGELVEILCEGSRIESVAPPSINKPDVRAGWAAPALFDLQINGCDSRSFNSEKLTVEDVQHVVDVCRRHGLGAFCPTLITNRFAALAHGFKTLARARLSTHLGNGTHAVLPRHRNYVWEQLAADDLWASIICDGHHLTPAVVRCIVRVKTPARAILTCDASSLAGLPPGRYREWDQEFEVLPEGKVVVPGTSFLAGSWAFTDVCIDQVLRCTDASRRQALDLAGTRPPKS